MSTKDKKAVREGKFSRCVKAPIRILTRVRDFYVKSMSNCASNVSNYGGFGAIGCPASHVATSLPQSFSVRSSASSNDDDFAELMRAASTRSLGRKIESELLRQQQSSPMGGANFVPRSHTVAIGRIDEEKPCDFGDDFNLKTDVFPRSKSHAVNNGRVF